MAIRNEENFLTAIHNLYCYCFKILPDHLNKLIEQVPAIVRARSCFRMVLYRKGGFALHSYTFYRLIIEVYVGDLDMVGFLHCFGINTESVVLSGDLALAANKVLYRVI